MALKDHRLIYATLFALMLHVLLFAIPAASSYDGAAAVLPALRTKLVTVVAPGKQPDPAPSEVAAKSVTEKQLVQNKATETPVKPARPTAATPRHAAQIVTKSADEKQTPSLEAKAVTATTAAGVETASIGGMMDTAKFGQTQSASVQSEKPSLSQLLHDAIARSKRYPTSARRMGREGNARVAFLLTPSGAVADIKLANSSGSSSLDRAALLAVARIAPFKPAGSYLSEEEKFAVDVVFRIN